MAEATTQVARAALTEEVPAKEAETGAQEQAVATVRPPIMIFATITDGKKAKRFDVPDTVKFADLRAKAAKHFIGPKREPTAFKLTYTDGKYTEGVYTEDRDGLTFELEDDDDVSSIVRDALAGHLKGQCCRRSPFIGSLIAPSQTQPPLPPA